MEPMQTIHFSRSGSYGSQTGACFTGTMVTNIVRVCPCRTSLTLLLDVHLVHPSLSRDSRAGFCRLSLA